VVAATASTALWIGGDLTGARYYDRLIQLDAAPSIEAGPPPTGDHNRAFASAVRLDDEIVVAGGLRITTGAITDVTGAIPGARIDLATGAATDLPLADFTPAAYLATAQLPRSRRAGQRRRDRRRRHLRRHPGVRDRAERALRRRRSPRAPPARPASRARAISSRASTAAWSW
jgi:hypothetical protein